MLKLSYITLTLSIVALLIIGCSGGASNPAMPLDEPAPTLPERQPESQRVLWGMWNICFDTTKLTVTIEPIRNAQKHFNITHMVTPPACDDCLKIKVNSFNPVTRILNADVTLRNPTKLSARDIRGSIRNGHAELRKGIL